MNHHDARTFFNRQQEAWEARDADALARAYTEDGTILSPIFRTVQGNDAIAQSFRALFDMFADWQYAGQELLVDGDSIAQPFVVRATHTREFMGLPGSGRTFEIQGVCLFKMKDGLIAYERRYYDFTGMLIQLGVLRGKPARPETSGTPGLRA